MDDKRRSAAFWPSGTFWSAAFDCQNKKCKVVYFLSGNGNQYTNTENLLVRKYGVTSGIYFFINRYIPHQNANTNFDQICIKGEISHAQGRNSQKDRRPVRNWQIDLTAAARRRPLADNIDTWTWFYYGNKGDCREITYWGMRKAVRVKVRTAVVFYMK